MAYQSRKHLYILKTFSIPFFKPEHKYFEKTMEKLILEKKGGGKKEMKNCV